MSRVLVLSLYELGQQPLGCAIPTALLRAEGHHVRQHDLSVEDWSEDDFDWAEAVVCSVPMHTALRLGLETFDRARATRPELPFAFHGLYAPVAAQTGVLGEHDLAAAGDVEGRLIEWVAAHERGEGSGGVHVELSRRPHAVVTQVVLPQRADLPGLDRYARLLRGGEELLVGGVESTQGCNHRCRHCPVPTVYNGRSRVIEAERVLADIDQLVESGARHIHFADPDFLNRPRHALALARLLKERHPGASFDATIKVSHILRYEDLFEELADCGLCFVVSAFESTSDTVLAALDKGHVAADEARAVQILRKVGIEVRPSLLPFTPWTTRNDLVELLDFVARHDLIWNVDPVQYGIRLLLPPGSLLLGLEDPVLHEAIVGYDKAELGYDWQASDATLDELARELALLTESLSSGDVDPDESYRQVRATVFSRLGLFDHGAPVAEQRGIAGPLRPRLSEAWFCCAEPTRAQYHQLGAETCGDC
ncbi:MAG TPA: radical SAM protein [Gaiellaceae bacterium]|nr:radical SAM protein [Gaiellaceae bacterium]